MIKKNRKLSALLFLSFACLLYGLGFAYIERGFDRVSAGILVLGMVCLIVCFLSMKDLSAGASTANLWKKYAKVFFIYLLYALVLFEVNYIAGLYDRRLDLTRNKQHTLSSYTRDILKSLKGEIKLTALYVGFPPQYLEDLLKEYERNSEGKIEMEIVDPLVRIGYAAQFGNVINGREKKLIVRSGKERRDVDFTDEPLTEQDITNALLRISRPARKVYFLTGHREYDLFSDKEDGLDTFAKLLLANNIIPQPLMLGMTGEIPADCDVLVIAGPRAQLSEKEEQLIKDYLNKGGDALFLIENVLITTPDKALTEEELDLNPSLNSILKDWGIEIKNDIVVDLASHISGDVGCPATKNYMTHRAIVSDLDYTFYIRPRSISMLKDRERTKRVAPLVLTASGKQSWGETNRNLQIKYDEYIDREGPVPIAFVIWESRLEKPDRKTSDTRLIVFTDADFLSNAFVDQFSNAKMGLNVINWLSETDYQIFMQEKEPQVATLNLTSRQKRIVTMILLMIPVLIVTSGIMVWIQQKR